MMELANQTFYFVLFSTFLGLLASFYWGKHSQKDFFNSFYWPLGLAAYLVSSLAFFLSPWLGKVNLTIANMALLVGSISIYFLFNVWNNSLNKVKQVLFLVGLLATFGMYVFLLETGSASDRIHLMNAAIVITSICQLSVLLSLHKTVDSHQIQLLILADLVQVIVRLARSGFTYLQDTPGITMLFQEDLVGFSLRVLSGLTSLMICILISNFYLEKLMQEHEKSAFAIENGLLNGLNSLSMARDNETGAHILRTSKYVELIAQRLRSMNQYVEELSHEAIQDIAQAAPLHDIGKVGIPDAILKKQAPLTEEEWVIMKTHTTLGEQVLRAAMMKDVRHTSVLNAAIEIASCHHENWDGSGYPKGLRGPEIPLSARMMSLADMYDALMSERVYKKPWTHEEACAEIRRLKGIRFDPVIVEAFLMEQDHFLEIANTYRDAS